MSETRRRILTPGRGRWGTVFITVELEGERLSISGVEGPLSNGNALGSCGQIVDTLDELTTLFPGWTPELVRRLKAEWERWHLNDMRAGCEHQRKGWNTLEPLEVVTYGMNSAGHKARREAEAEAIAAAREGRIAVLTPAQKWAIRPDWFRDTFEAPDADSPASGLVEVKKRETKTAGWVTRNEHPRGLLSEPCEVCGYKFGHEWRREEVPADVLAFLFSLPEAGHSLPCGWARG